MLDWLYTLGVIDPYKLEANKYIKYLKCVGLCYNLSLGFMRQMKCNWLFKVLKHLSVNSDQSIGIDTDWGGLFRDTFRVVITDNHVTTFELINDECLLEYNCGIML